MPLAAASLIVVGCGSDGGSKTVAPPKPTASLLASWHALERAPCPPAYLAIDSKSSYPAAEVAQARRGLFRIKGHDTKLDVPIDWAMDPYDSRSFRGILASLKWIDPLIYASRHGDRGALTQARDIALDWVAHNPRNRPPADKSWENKIVGDRAPYLAYVTRAAACQGMLSQKQGLFLIRSLRQHGRALTSNKLYKPSNHGLFMDYGLEALAKTAAFLPKSPEWEPFAPRRFMRTLGRRIYPSEGFWLENSSSYHLAVLKLVREFDALAGSSAPPALHRLTRRMTDVAGWLIEPDGKRVLLGDSNLKVTPPEALSAGRGDDGMLFLRRSGIAMVKRPRPDPSYLMFASTFQNGTHNQADALTLDLYADRQRILSDSGLFDKEEDPWQEYSRDAYSHSVMTIDRKSFPLDKKFRYHSGLRASGQGDGWFAIQGVNPNAERVQGVRHARLVLYKPGYALVVVDSTRSAKPHSYERYFQLGKDLTAKKAGSSTVSLTGKHGFEGQLTSTGTAPSTVTLAHGQTDPVRGWLFPRYRKRVPRPTAQFTASGRNLDEVATLSLVQGGAPLVATLDGPVTRSGVSVTLRKGGKQRGRVDVRRFGSHLRVTAH